MLLPKPCVTYVFRPSLFGPWCWWARLEELSSDCLVQKRLNDTLQADLAKLEEQTRTYAGVNFSFLSTHNSSLIVLLRFLPLICPLKSTTSDLLYFTSWISYHVYLNLYDSQLLNSSIKVCFFLSICSGDWEVLWYP